MENRDWNWGEREKCVSVCDRVCVCVCENGEQVGFCLCVSSMFTCFTVNTKGMSSLYIKSYQLRV